MITIDRNKIEDLYNEVSEITHNFKTIKSEIMEEKPQRLLIFRLLLNMSQWQLAKLIHRSQGTIYTIENGIRKSLNRKVIQKVISEVVKIKQTPDKEILIERYSQIADRGTFRGGEYTRKMSLRASKERSIKGAVSTKPTEQERTFMETLNSEKISYKFHSVIEANRKFVVDFSFPSEKPKVILEMKRFDKNYRKRLQAIDLAYRAIKIRQRYPEIKLIVVLEGNLQEEMSSILKDEYDHIFVNDSKENVIKTIKLLVNS